MSGQPKTVELYYDVVSPYAWVGFEVLCRYRNKWNIDLKFKPFFLGGVMQGSGNKPPASVAAKGMYMTHDVENLRNYYQIPLNQPSNTGETLFSKGSLRAMRFLTAVNQTRPDRIEHVSRALWMRIWSKDEDIHEQQSLVEAGIAGGLSEKEAKDFVAKSNDPDVKDKLKAVTQEALDHGAFGAPTVIVEDAKKQKQMIFGSDRIHIVGMLIGETFVGPLTEYAASKL